MSNSEYELNRNCNKMSGFWIHSNPIVSKSKKRQKVNIIENNK